MPSSFNKPGPEQHTQAPVSATALVLTIFLLNLCSDGNTLSITVLLMTE